MITLDVLKIAKPEIRDTQRGGLKGLFKPERRTWYVIEPKVLYPKMVAYIQDALVNKRHQSEGTKFYYRQAKRLPVEGWIYALEDRSECPEEYLSVRRQALEIARLWFTQLLWDEVGKQPIGIHILEDKKYRL